MGTFSLEPAALPSVASPPSDSAAARDARANWLANLRAMSLTQPTLAQFIQHMAADEVEWVFARDGSLTAIDRGKWYGGCSLPRRAAAAMLPKISQPGVTVCMAAPSHAAQIQQVLMLLQPEQAMIILEADLHRLWIGLHCCDFSDDFTRHRLWFAAGADWPDELRWIFADHPGLPTPAQSIRTPLVSDDLIAECTSRVQRVVAEQNQQRSAQVLALRNRPRPGPRRIDKLCIICPSRFRLWNDAGFVLGQTICEGAALQGIQCVRFDSDDPVSSSPLALAQSAAECGAVLAANIGRAELASAIPQWLPLITWVTSARIPPRNDADSGDALLLADPAWAAAARNAGWPQQRLGLARWPAMSPTAQPEMPAHLAIIADTTDLYAARCFDLSSHGLLWEMIRAELLKDPFAASSNPSEYLKGRMQRLGIQEQGFQQANFIRDLIVPAVGQGIARIITSAGLPLRIHGHGWPEIPDLAHVAAGPIINRVGLQQACHGATALVHLWPANGAHPIEAFGRSIVRGADRNSLLNEARRALSAQARSARGVAAGENLNLSCILTVLT